MTELTQWLGEHQQWILLATGLLAFFESLALVGIIIPGVALLFAAAAAAGSANIDLWQLLAAGFIGAVCGDGVSFLLGRHFHTTICQLPPFNKHPEWIDKGEIFFQKYGIASIVIGRFIGPIRPVMPLVAGMLEMPAYRFFGINLLSALAWSPFYLLPGYFIGAAAESQQFVQTQHFALLAGLIFFPWLISTWLLTYRKRLQSNSQRQRAAALAFSISAAVFAATYLLTNNGHLNDFNLLALEAFNSLRLAPLDDFFVAITLLGYAQPMIIWSGAVTITLLLQRHVALTATWVAATLTTYFSISWLKNTIALPRPMIVQQPPASFSFPSGHTAITIVFMGTLLLLARNNLTPKAYKAWLLTCTGVSALVACSRLYLGVHWVSDIIAGICLGVMVLAFFYGVLQQRTALRYAKPSASPKALIFASCIGIIGAYALVIVPSFNDNKQHYHPTQSSPSDEQQRITTKNNKYG